MQDQDQVRKRLIEYITDLDVKQTYISKHCNNLPTPILSRFKNGIRDLNQDSLDTLNEFLISKGY